MSHLPKGWEQLHLADIAYVESGIGFPLNYQGEKSGDLAFFKVGDISRAVAKFGGQLKNAQHYVSFSVASELKGKPVLAGATVFAKIGEAIRLNRRAFVLEDCLIDNNVMAVKAFDFRTDRFLFRFMQSQDISKLARSTTVPSLRKGDIEELHVPFAPLNEQKRIADKLDAVLARGDACRNHLDRIPTILKRFRQSVLAAAYTGRLTESFRMTVPLTSVEESVSAVETPPRPNRFSSSSDSVVVGNYALAVGKPDKMIPEGWCWTPLVDIARMESGHTPSRAHPEYWSGGDIPWIGIADARDGHSKTIYDTYQHTNALGLANSAARLLPLGTVCLSRTASVGYVVRMGVDMATSQDFVNWTCTAAINPDWLKFLLVAETDAIYRFGKGSTHTTVYYPELVAFQVALPSIEEQTEIVRRVEYLFAFADRLQARYTTARTQIEKLTPAILSKAFRGELVPQDLNDEPASALLERLRATSTAAPVKVKIRKSAGRPIKTQKAEVTMFIRKDISDTHLSAILKERGQLSAKALWTASQLNIDEFYDQLKEEETRGLLKEVGDAATTEPRMLEAIA